MTVPDAGAANPDRLTVAITGSSGLIGTALGAMLRADGHHVIRLVRKAGSGSDERQWLPLAPEPSLLAGVDAVVHLAGAPIGRRFSQHHKRIIRESRLEPTRRLADLMARTPEGPDVFISASAIGFYGPDRGDDVLTESSSQGSGFVADLVVEWEKATAPAQERGLRVAIVRTGIVQSRRGGTLGKVLPLFRAGLGGRMGSGTQWTSWIDIDDLCAIYRAVLVQPTYSGPLNAVAPNPVRNNEFTSTLGGVLKRPTVLPVPKVALAAVLGTEGANELALASQRVHSERLGDLGFTFSYPTLEACLRHQLLDPPSSVAEVGSAPR
jgi:uncharacterized protein